MDYDAAVAGLRSRGRFGISLGLARIEALLDELGNPQRSLRGALVGGTNGKGSVVALARSVLQVAGLRVGTMPKPHLVSYRERIAIDGIPISRERFAAALASVMPAIDAVGDRLGPPTEFEALTAAAFVELTRAGVDLALVEVGLGGRLDATNVLDAGVAAITNVQHDHERLLGSTLAAIGAEKAAIIKPGNLAVTGARGRGLVPILERCAAVGAPLRRAGPGQPYHVTVRDSGWDGLVVDATTPAKGPCLACGSGCWGATRRRTQRSRWLSSTRWPRTRSGAASACRSTKLRFDAASPPRAGQAGWSCSRSRLPGASCSTAPTTRPGPALSPGRWASWGCGASRWSLGRRGGSG